MTFASLFDGIYGFGLGLEAAGMECVCRVELSDYPTRVTCGWRPGTKHKRDVRKTSGTRFRGVGLLCGGFPCQDLSVAGKRKGLAGKRSGLFHELVRICDEARPRWLLWENVPGLLSSNAGRDFWTVNAALAEIGYFGAWRVLDSQHFGVAQRRRRVFGLYAEGYSGACRAAAVLLEPEGSGWNPQTGRYTGQRDSGAPAGGAGELGIQGSGISHSLSAHHSGQRLDHTEQELIPCEVASAISASAGHHGHSSPRGDGSDNLIAWHENMSASLTGSECTRALRAGASHSSQCVVEPNVEVIGPLTGSGRSGGYMPNAENVRDGQLIVGKRPLPPWEEWIAATRDLGGTREEYDRLLEDRKVYAIEDIGRKQSGGAEVGLGVREDVMYTLNSAGKHGVGPVAPTLSTKNEVASSSTQREKWMETSVEATGTVRRLTPTECEKLQGFPPGWTIPADKWTGWLLPKGLDSARYRALGNAVTTNVVYWIGLRIMAMEKLLADGLELDLPQTA